MWVGVASNFKGGDLRRKGLIRNVFFVLPDLLGLRPPLFCSAEDPNHPIAATTYNIAIGHSRHGPYRDCRVNDCLRTLAICYTVESAKPACVPPKNGSSHHATPEQCDPLHQTQCRHLAAQKVSTQMMCGLRVCKSDRHPWSIPEFHCSDVGN